MNSPVGNASWTKKLNPSPRSKNPVIFMDKNPRSRSFNVKFIPWIRDVYLQFPNTIYRVKRLNDQFIELRTSVTGARIRGNHALFWSPGLRFETDEKYQMIGRSIQYGDTPGDSTTLNVTVSQNRGELPVRHGMFWELFPTRSFMILSTMLFLLPERC